MEYLQEWAEEEMRLHPGTKYIIEEYFPGHKDKILRTWYKAKSMGSVERTFSWSFTCDDPRALQRGEFRRTRGGDPSEADPQRSR